MSTRSNWIERSFWKELQVFCIRACRADGADLYDEEVQKMKVLSNVKIGKRLGIGFGIILGLTVLVIVVGAINSSVMKSKLDRIVNVNNVKIAAANEVRTATDMVVMSYATLLLAKDQATIEREKKAVDVGRARYKEGIERIKKLEINDEGKKLITDVEEAIAAARDADNKSLELAKAGKAAEAAAYFASTARPAIMKVNERADVLVKYQEGRSKFRLEEADKAGTSTSILLFVIGALAIVIGSFLGIAISRSITRPVAKALEMMGEMAKGHLGMRLNLEQKDEIGEMGRSMDFFFDLLQNVAIATMRKVAEGDVSTDIPLRDEKDEVATALQGIITSLRSLIAETQMLSSAAVEGKLAVRGNPDKFHGAYKEIVQGFNGTLDSIIGPLNIAEDYMERISKGEMPPKIAETYRGDLNEMKNSINLMIETMSNRGNDVNLLIQSILDGKLDMRAETSKYSGFHKGAIDGVNALVEGMVRPLKVAASYVDRISKGDIPSKITEEYKGDFNEIKNNLNVLIDAMNDITTAAGEIAGGNLLVTINERSPQDRLMQALSRMVADLRAMFREVTQGVQTLSSASTELSAISDQMSQGAEQTSVKANGMAGAVEQMSSNMTSVAAAMEQASTNITIVAASTEEMTSTIGEIAKNSEKARSITVGAVDQADKVTEKVSELGRAAKDIGKVTETISAISAQTNLLALNATIEAARAGAAGKGFAVVANEIKELAQQTASATEDIKNRIEGIQSTTSMTVVDIETISKVIQEVNEIVSGIAAAIEEQSAVTKDIAGNVAQAAQGIQEVNQHVSQTSAAAETVTQEVVEVNQALGEISSSSAQVLLSSQELSRLAEQLKDLMSRFMV
jgi:methyl-accepting chemotaxis protein